MLRNLTEAECLSAIQRGEFDPAVLSEALFTALVLTQSWCPQWMMMRSWLGAAAADPEIAVMFVEYDREPYFDDFMAFKEDVLGNREVPYVRYYRKGAFARDSNYIDRKGFLTFLRGQA